MNLLALDLATRTGWCLREAGRLESGAETFDIKRGQSAGMRYVAFNRWLQELVAPESSSYLARVELIAYEQPFVMRSGAAAEIALGFATRVQEFCCGYGLEYVAVNGMTLKKWTTGRGNAKKPEMMEAVARRFGRRVDDDNEADAVALLHYVEAEIVPAGAR